MLPEHSLTALGFRGIITLPRNVDLRLKLNIYDGELRGDVAHAGEICGHNSKIYLKVVGNLGINVTSEHYNPIDYHIDGSKLPEGNKYISPFLPYPPRWLRINSSKSKWNITYPKPA